MTNEQTLRAFFFSITPLLAISSFDSACLLPPCDVLTVTELEFSLTIEILPSLSRVSLTPCQMKPCSRHVLLTVNYFRLTVSVSSNAM
jgi:hypothetical protein